MHRTRACLIVSMAALLAGFVAFPAQATNSADTIYTYDELGRLMTALTSATGVCIAYSYDANGNRTAQTITVSGGTVSPIWGTGVAGCFLWTAQ